MPWIITQTGSAVSTDTYFFGPEEEATAGGPVSISIGPSSITATGQALVATYPIPVDISIGTASIVATGQPLTILADGSVIVDIAPSTIIATGQALSVTAGGSASIGIGSASITASGSPLSLENNVGVSIGTASIVTTGNALSVSVSTGINIGSGTIVTTGQSLAIDNPVSIAIAPASIVATGQPLVVYTEAVGGGGGILISTGGQVIANYSDVAVPLILTVDAGGGIAGLDVQVMIRKGGSTTDYLDFNDSTFKSTGWIEKSKAMIDIDNGFYTETLDVSSLEHNRNLIAEYSVSGIVTGIAAGIISFPANAVMESSIESNFNVEESLKIILATLGGKISGAGTGTIAIRDLNDTKDVITATVDGDGNRLALIRDVT